MPPNVKALAAIITLALVTLLHALLPKFEAPIVTCLLGGLGIAAALLVSRPKDAAWIALLEKALEDAQPGALAKLKAGRSRTLPPPPPLHVLMFLLVAPLAGCISSAPIVPVTPANQAQIATCQTTASWHNGVVIGGFGFGASATALGGVGALVADPGQKTGLSIGAAVAGGLAALATAIAGLTSSNFSSSHCSDVVGALPAIAEKKP